MKRIIVGISAADGVSIGYKLLKSLKPVADVETHLVISRSCDYNLRLELNAGREEIEAMADYSYGPEQLWADISSGSFVTDGMIVAPCSMKTLSAIAVGASGNLLTRAADVCLKERRKLVLVARETPLSLIHLRNMAAVTEAGGVILPPVMTFYGGAKTVEEQIDRIIGKAMLQFGVVMPRYTAWSGQDIFKDMKNNGL